MREIDRQIPEDEKLSFREKLAILEAKLGPLTKEDGPNYSKEELAFLQCEQKMKEEIRGRKTSFEELKERLLASESWIDRLMAVRNFGEFHSAQAAEYLYELYTTENLELAMDKSFLSPYYPWVVENLEPEGEEDEYGEFKDAILLSLIRNGKRSEQQLLKIFNSTLQKSPNEISCRN
jgi:hypothetical protein